MSTNTAVHRDMFHAVCGDRIGTGMSREVYACTLNPAWVVKVEDGACHFQNVIEWEIWSGAKDRDAGRWLAPCHFISPNGSILIQSRTTPARTKEYPDRMPAFLTDFKRANYGLIGKRFVCHDYGTALVLDNGLSTRLRKAGWWE